MSTQYRIVTEGKLREGVDPEQFVHAFVQMFKVPEDKARKLLAAGRAVTLKDNLDKDTAEKFQRVLEGQTGLEVRVEAIASLSLMSDGAEVVDRQSEEPAPSDTAERCPKCGSDRVVGDDCLACGIIISRYRARQTQTADETPSIYAAPTSNVLPDKEEPGYEEFGVRKVDAGNGWHWIVGGWRHFTGNPVAWIAALVVWYIIILVANLIPFIGPLAINILSPVFIAGFMLGASEQDNGGDFTFQHLFAGFSADLGKLVQVGLLYLAGSVIVGLVVFVFFGLMGLGSLMHNVSGAASGGGPGVITILLLILIVMTVAILLSMAFWYVPLLVVFDELGPMQAIPMSFSACWRNAIPFLIYGLVAGGLAVVAVIPFGLGLLVFAPVMIASIYVSYRDIFHGSSLAA